MSVNQDVQNGTIPFKLTSGGKYVGRADYEFRNGELGDGELRSGSS